MPLTAEKPAWAETRLPRRDVLTVPDIASAMMVSSRTVHNWIDSGEFSQASGDRHAVLNVGSRTLPRYRISRSAVVALIKSRSV